jgi:hypothetical protein
VGRSSADFNSKKPFISGSIEVTPDAVGPGRPGWLRYDARAEVMGPWEL